MANITQPTSPVLLCFQQGLICNKMSYIVKQRDCIACGALWSDEKDLVNKNLKL